MLHILWVILKILLIIIGVLLGLILLTAAFLLFCPIRYRGEGQKEDRLTGRAKVSWLFRILTYTVEYEAEKTSQIFRIFGIPLETYRRFGAGVKGVFSHRKKKKVKKRLPPEEESPPLMEKEEWEIKLEEAEEVLRRKDAASKEELPSDEEGESHLGGRFHPISMVGSGIRRILAIVRRIWQLPGKILKGIRKIVLSFRSFCANIERWKTFLDDERTKDGLALGWTEGKKLLRHIGPRKIEGNLIFGREDPSVTGQVLGLLGMTMPLHKNALEITPVFGENILRGQIRLKGRIYLIVFLKAAIRLYFDKNIKFMMKVMKKEG